jgi:hypothetical protein
MLTILELADQAILASHKNPEESDLTVATILHLLDAVGSSNAHLKNPLSDPLQYYSEPRESPLSGKEPVYGEYLALAYRRHDLSVHLHSYDSLELLEQFLASNDGWIHPFVTHCVAFVAGKVEPYRIGYKAEDGSTELFDKWAYGARFSGPATRATQRWIVWSRAGVSSR